MIPDNKKNYMSRFNILLTMLCVLLFAQLYIKVGEITIRTEDLLIILLLFLIGIIVWGDKFIFYTCPLNKPLILWMSVIIVGILNTYLQPFSLVTKKNAIINGIRILLSLSVFFVVNHYPGSAHKKARIFVRSVVVFSFITTVVALLQISYWDGWLPISLPAAFTELKEGANPVQGREIFALFVNDTGTHGWTHMLAMQALTVFYVARNLPNRTKRTLWYGYFMVLFYILIRTSVRVSILGLFLSIFLIEIKSLQEVRNVVKILRRSVLIVFIAFIFLLTLFAFTPESYFFERVRQAVPKLSGGQLDIGGSNILGRFIYGSVALKLFLRKPIIGNGFWSFGDLSEKYSPFRIVHAHNSYLQTLADFGIIGTLSLVWLIVRIARFSKYIWHQRFDSYYLSILQKVWVGSLVFIALAALVANPFWNPKDIAFRMIVAGVLMTASREIFKYKNRYAKN